jgi:hypothetical protein
LFGLELKVRKIFCYKLGDQTGLSCVARALVYVPIRSFRNPKFVGRPNSRIAGYNPQHLSRRLQSPQMAARFRAKQALLFQSQRGLPDFFPLARYPVAMEDFALV